MGDERVEILKEEPFLKGNEKWGGKVQVLRVTVTQPNGTTRTYINKRLVFTETGRSISLPRAGIEEVIAAIVSASMYEREQYEALLEQMNLQQDTSRHNKGPHGPASRRPGDSHRRNKE